MAIYPMESDILHFHCWRQKWYRSWLLPNRFRTTCWLWKWEKCWCVTAFQIQLPSRNGCKAKHILAWFRNRYSQIWRKYKITFRIPNNFFVSKYLRNCSQYFSNYLNASELIVHQLRCLPTVQFGNHGRWLRVRRHNWWCRQRTLLCPRNNHS